VHRDWRPAYLPLDGFGLGNAPVVHAIWCKLGFHYFLAVFKVDFIIDPGLSARWSDWVSTTL
jgi:hypothetical protein